MVFTLSDPSGFGLRLVPVIQFEVLWQVKNGWVHGFMGVQVAEWLVGLSLTNATRVRFPDRDLIPAP